MVEINLQINPRFFNETYLPYLYTQPKGKSRIMAFYGGAGSGKSVFVVQNTILKGLASKRRVLVVRKIGNTIRDSIFAEYKKALQQFGIISLCEIRESYLNITLPNGTEFIFKGMEDDEKIRSISGITDIVIEEASDISQDEYNQLNLRMRDAKSGSNQIFLMYNPVSKDNWVYKMFHDPKTPMNRPKSFTLVHTTYEHNKFLPQDYLDELRKMKYNNPTYYEVFALGKFANLGKLVFNNWSKEKQDLKRLVREGYTLHFGLDFGFSNDPTVLMCVAVHAEKRKIYIFDEHYEGGQKDANGYDEKGMTNLDISNMLKKRRMTGEVIKADSSEPKSIVELRRNGIRGIRPARKGRDSVMHGIQMLQSFEITISPVCVHTIEEFENYTWKKNKKTNEYENVPIATFNHCIDALRYACEDFLPKNRIRSTTKASFGL